MAFLKYGTKKVDSLVHALASGFLVIVGLALLVFGSFPDNDGFSWEHGVGVAHADAPAPPSSCGGGDGSCGGGCGDGGGGGGGDGGGDGCP